MNPVFILLMEANITIQEEHLFALKEIPQGTFRVISTNYMWKQGTSIFKAASSQWGSLFLYAGD